MWFSAWEAARAKGEDFRKAAQCSMSYKHDFHRKKKSVLSLLLEVYLFQPEVSWNLSINFKGPWIRPLTSWECCNTRVGIFYIFHEEKDNKKCRLPLWPVKLGRIIQEKHLHFPFQFDLILKKNVYLWLFLLFPWVSYTIGYIYVLLLLYLGYMYLFCVSKNNEINRTKLASFLIKAA